MKHDQRRIETTSNIEVDLNYQLYTPSPPISEKGPLPLLLFLHGMGERGNDLSLVELHGPPRLIRSGTDFPFIVAAPQCPMGKVWQIEPLIALLNALIEDHDVDQSRIYVTGLSMGGAATWALANACPGRFAAIAPICGPFTMVDPENLKGTPTWCFHGAIDETVSVNDSLRMARWLRESGADIRLTLYPEAGHDCWTEAYEGDELYQWFLTHSNVRHEDTHLR